MNFLQPARRISVISRHIGLPNFREVQRVATDFPVRLERIPESAFDDFVETILPVYIEERAVADRVSKAAAEQSARQQHAEILQAGYHTPGHHFTRIIDAVTNLSVGDLWFRLDSASGEVYVYHLQVAPEQCRKGYASAALNAVAHLARSQGCARIALDVFAGNTAAQSLHRKLGFSIVGLHMNKPL